MRLTDTRRRELVTVVLEQNVPVRLEWEGRRYYLDEPPEPLGRLVVTLHGERPDPSMVTGWRIHASTVDGDFHVFDVVARGDARWQLTRLD